MLVVGDTQVKPTGTGAAIVTTIACSSQIRLEEVARLEYKSISICIPSRERSNKPLILGLRYCYRVVRFVVLNH
jgi:hypothetical protein